jgi:hypothetical protein
MLSSRYRFYNESQFMQHIASLARKSCDLYIVVQIFVMRIPGMRKVGGHHTVVPPLLRELNILNTNNATLQSLGWVYSALPCSQNIVRLCIVHLSMQQLSGFADVTAIEHTVAHVA